MVLVLVLSFLIITYKNNPKSKNKWMLIAFVLFCVFVIPELYMRNRASELLDDIQIKELKKCVLETSVKSDLLVGDKYDLHFKLHDDLNQLYNISRFKFKPIYESIKDQHLLYRNHQKNTDAGITLNCWYSDDYSEEESFKLMINEDSNRSTFFIGSNDVRYSMISKVNKSLYNDLLALIPK
jgi:hypothetical protein